MSDIVERWKEELESLGGKPMTTAEHYANDLAGIVESLRQRVKELEVLAESRLESLSAVYVQLDALKTGRNALAEFNECWSDEDGNDPIERLRFFCSLAMRGQDWLDVEPFFDALKQSQGEPVATVMRNKSGQIFMAKMDGNPFNMSEYVGKTFYTAPTIPEGWQLVPIEPTPGMLDSCDDMDWQ